MEWTLNFGHSFPTRGVTDPIAWPTAVVCYRQDEYSVIVDGIDERMTKFSEGTLSVARSNLRTRFRELGDHLFGPLNLSKKTAPEPIRSKLKIADLVQQFLLGSLMIFDRRHRRRFSAFL